MDSGIDPLKLLTSKFLIFFFFINNKKLLLIISKL